jgi:hypothetical protein
VAPDQDRDLFFGALIIPLFRGIVTWMSLAVEIPDEKECAPSCPSPSS